MITNSISRFLLDSFSDSEGQYVFLVPSVNINDFCSELVKHPNVQPIVACTELGAGFMAEGYALLRQDVAFVASGGGPGALYMLPSAILARISHIPILFITGDAPSQVREQYVFQFSGYEGSRDATLYKAGIGHSVLVTSPIQFSSCWDSCCQALSKSSPAHIIIPMDYQESIDEIRIDDKVGFSIQHENNTEKLNELADHWHQAQSPLLVLGHRLLHTVDYKLIHDFVDACGVPVILTFGAKGLLPEHHPLNLGNFGFGGTEESFNALKDGNHDFVLFVGANMGQREEFNWARHFDKDHNHRKIFRIDIREPVNEGEFKPHKEIHVTSFQRALKFLLSKLPCTKHALPTPHKYSKSNNDHIELDEYLISSQKFLPNNTILFTDAGLHRLSAGRSWKIFESGTFFSSPEQAPMGWAIAAGIGGKLACPQAPVVILTGDGCMRMLGQEIATAARYKISLIIMVANNSSFGSTQKAMANHRTATEIGDLPIVDWVKFSQVFGGDGCRVESCSEVGSAIDKALNCQTPFVIDIILRTPREEQ